jgi:hypothetical protein
MRNNTNLLKMADTIRDFVIDFEARLGEILERLARIEIALRNSTIQIVEEKLQNPDAWVDTKEAANILGVAASTLYKDRHIQSRRFPYSKVGGIIRYKVGDLIKLMEEHKIAS